MFGDVSLSQDDCRPNLLTHKTLDSGLESRFNAPERAMNKASEVPELGRTKNQIKNDWIRKPRKKDRVTTAAASSRIVDMPSFQLILCSAFNRMSKPCKWNYPRLGS